MSVITGKEETSKKLTSEIIAKAHAALLTNQRRLVAEVVNVGSAESGGECRQAVRQVGYIVRHR
jgi:hypothetical protein